jgi:hypothetical protein
MEQPTPGFRTALHTTPTPCSEIPFLKHPKSTHIVPSLRRTNAGLRNGGRSRFSEGFSTLADVSLSAQGAASHPMVYTFGCGGNNHTIAVFAATRGMIHVRYRKQLTAPVAPQYVDRV